MHINYLIKELEILNKRIFFSREHNIMFLTTPKCGSQFIKLFCLLNFTDPTGQGKPNDFFNSNNPELKQFFPNEKLSMTVTVAFFLISCETTSEPINPAPPVTNILLSFIFDISIIKFYIISNPINRRF